MYVYYGICMCIHNTYEQIDEVFYFFNGQLVFLPRLGGVVREYYKRIKYTTQQSAVRAAKGRTHGKCNKYYEKSNTTRID